MVRTKSENTGEVLLLAVTNIQEKACVGWQVCRQAMLAAGALQSLLQHLHQLLLPIISPTAAAASGGAVSPGGGSTASRGKLVVAADNLDILLATLEALASSDAAADRRTSAEVSQPACLHIDFATPCDVSALVECIALVILFDMLFRNRMH